MFLSCPQLAGHRRNILHSLSRLGARLQNSSYMASPQNRRFLPAAAAHEPSTSPQPALQIKSFSEDDTGNASIDNMLDGPTLDDINNMLMDEAMDKQENCSNTASYQAILGGFYQMLEEQSPYPPNYSSQPPGVREHCISCTPLPASGGLNRTSFQGDVRRHVVACSTVSSAAAGRIADQNMQAVHTSVRQQYSSCGQSAGRDGRPRRSSCEDDDDLSFVENRDLNIEEHYTNLYIQESLPAAAARRAVAAVGKRGARANYRRQRASASSNKEKGMKGKHSEQEEDLGLVDLGPLLVSCAQAVARADARQANDILEELRQSGASPRGSGLQRIAHYFSEALKARMYGTGSRFDSTAAMSNVDRKSAALQLLKALKMAFRVCPNIKISHYFANMSILMAAEGASRLHIVDYGILSGVQWPYLISALADRKEGPPFLHITGIDFPQSGGLNPAESLDNTGRRLAEYATAYKVPFEYHSIAASKWEEIEPGRLHLRRRQGEVLVVNCHLRLRHVLDESTVVANDPRKQLLSMMRSLNPDLFVTGVKSVDLNSPFSVFRFRQALHYYSSKFDMLDATLCRDSPERMILERDIMGRAIINIVACEGIERVERPETYKQWQARIKQAGFEQLPIIPTVLSVSRSHVQKHYHKDFNIHTDSNTWMLSGWKGRTVEAISAWKPIP